MTKEEFWKQLEDLAVKAPEKMPSLIRDVLLAAEKEEIMGCGVDGKIYALCVMDPHPVLPQGRSVEEVGLDNTFYHDMVTEGYAGLAVETMGNIYCIPWSDIFSGRPAVNTERKYTV